MTHDEQSNEMNEVFATRLSRLMEENSKKQTDIAECLGITRQAVSKYTDGSVLPNMEKLKKLCDFFNVPSDYLLGISDSDSLIPENRYCSDLTGLTAHSLDVLNKLHNSSEIKDQTILMFINAMLKYELSMLSNHFLRCANCYIIEHKTEQQDIALFEIEGDNFDYNDKISRFLTVDWFEAIIDDIEAELYQLRIGEKNE